MRVPAFVAHLAADLLDIAAQIHEFGLLIELDIADAGTLADLLTQCALPAHRLAESREPAIQQRYQAHTKTAIDAGIFGAPSYVVGGEIFWGQDRLDFLQRYLETPSHSVH